MKKVVEVVAAVIYNNDKFLIARKKKGKVLEGLWEFPGGKVEHNEEYKQALIREIKEELNFDISVKNKIISNLHEYDKVIVNLNVYNAELLGGEMKLLDHDKVEWINISEVENYNIAPADVPAIERIINNV